MLYHPQSNGITWNGLHSRTDLGATCQKRQTPPPEPVRREVRVSYSNQTWDFSALSGIREYENRRLAYQFCISCQDHTLCRARVNAFLAWLYEPEGYQELYDSADSEYHYSAKLVKAVPAYKNGVCCEITVAFEAYPYRIPNSGTLLPVDETRFPDVDDDGAVTASDAQAILEAASNTGAGDPSGLTPEQELRADADRDGSITAADAQLVQDFVVSVGAGDFTNDPEGWTAYLNEALGRKPEVI